MSMCYFLFVLVLQSTTALPRPILVVLPLRLVISQEPAKPYGEEITLELSVEVKNVLSVFRILILLLSHLCLDFNRSSKVVATQVYVQRNLLLSHILYPKTFVQPHRVQKIIRLKS